MHTARLKAIEAEEESDINSDLELGFRHRKQTKNKKYLSGSDTENKEKNEHSEVSDSNEEDSEPIMPVMKTNMSSTNFCEKMDTLMLFNH